MNRAAYLIDIVVRGFFMFVVLDLLLRNLPIALLIAVGFNIIYELIVGRKFWQAWKNAPKKPHRSWRQIARELWRRAFSRERTKGLVFAGVVLLFMSYFVRLNIYYIVLACLVFTMATISRFAPPIKSVIIPHEPSHDTTSSQTNCPPTATK